MDRRDAGFSTLEALLALALTAMIGLAAVEAVSGGRRAAAASRARASDSVKLLRLDAALRRAVGEVRVPYWMGRVEAERFALGMLRELDGAVAKVAVEPVYDGGDIWGVKAAVQVRGVAVELRARIGSRPLPQGGSP